MTRQDAYEDIGALVRTAAATVHAPERLRADVERRRSRPRRAGALRLAAPVAVAAMLAVAVVITQTGTPTLHDVAAAALQTPTRPAPPTDPQDRRFVVEQVGGVRFPDYEGRWGWRAVGARTDEIDGRRAVTIVYRKAGRGVHYTIVDGSPLHLPGAARRNMADGTRVSVLRDGAARVVAWHKGGHTCVLASRDVDTAGLLKFVAWS